MNVLEIIDAEIKSLPTMAIWASDESKDILYDFSIPVARLQAAFDAIKELIAADYEIDVVQDMMNAAKRAKGSWNANPFGHGHPAVIAVSAARTRREAALKVITGDIA